jgi:hypothetical protein
MKRVPAAFFLIISLVAATGCGKKTTPVDPDCTILVEKILKCDPTAPPSMRSDPEKFCPPSRKPCASHDVSTPAGCAQFMGCLYDGE